jgi:hypothetical protein
LKTRKQIRWPDVPTRLPLTGVPSERRILAGPPVSAPFVEYIVGYGSSGGFGRFAAEGSLVCGRGERVVVESVRGLEMGVVLCPATPLHAQLLPPASGGRLLRPAAADDELAEEQCRQRAQGLFEECRRLASALDLPVEVLDAELLLDGRLLIVQHLAPPDCDAAALVKALAERQGLVVRLENLALSAGPAPPEEAHGGCGKPDCGRSAGGSCTSCSSGGCSSCGSGHTDLRAYFAHLRNEMEQHHQRTSLL